MELKRDAHGRPIGLQWPERPPISEEVLDKHRKQYDGFSRKGIGGRPSSEMCKFGEGPHKLSEWGKKRADGSTYCYGCHLERKRKNDAKRRQERKPSAALSKAS